MNHTYISLNSKWIQLDINIVVGVKHDIIMCTHFLQML